MQDPLPRPPGGDFFVPATSAGIAYLCLILSVYGKSIRKISHNKKAGLWKDRLAIPECAIPCARFLRYNYSLSTNLSLGKYIAVDLMRT